MASNKELAGATHALEERIWRKPAPELFEGTLYHVRVYDTVTGGCVMKSSNLTKTQVEELIKSQAAKCFVYEEPFPPSILP